MNIDIDLFGYAESYDLKQATGVDTSKLGKSADVATIRKEVDLLVKLKTMAPDLNKLSNQVDQELVELEKFRCCYLKNVDLISLLLYQIQQLIIFIRTFQVCLYWESLIMISR